MLDEALKKLPKSGHIESAESLEKTREMLELFILHHSLLLVMIVRCQLILYIPYFESLNPIFTCAILHYRKKKPSCPLSPKTLSSYTSKSSNSI